MRGTYLIPLMRSLKTFISLIAFKWISWSIPFLFLSSNSHKSLFLDIKLPTYRTRVTQKSYLVYALTTQHLFFFYIHIQTHIHKVIINQSKKKKLLPYSKLREFPHYCPQKEDMSTHKPNLPINQKERN